MRTTGNRFTIDNRRPDAGLIARAAEIIANGGAVVFPTHGLYGLGVRADSASAVTHLFELKQRPLQKPVSILIGNASDLGEYVRNVSQAAHRLVACFWPGRLTLVFEASDTVIPGLTAGTGTIGIRLPQHPVAAALAAATTAVTATSANLSGMPGVASADDLPRELVESVDMILDAGPLAGGTGSTVVDVTGSQPRVIREGAISKAQVTQCLAQP